jgi:hypothetical protein
MTDKPVQQPDEGVVERNALLFRAGSYPDRDIEITEQDLDRMIEGYTPAPIKVEHTDTPLRFGVVTKIWRVGRELFGRLAFNPLAWALARECGATRLSVAVRRDKTGLQEVSLVRSPRIADAAVFTGRCRVSGVGCQGGAPEDHADYFAGDDLAEGRESGESGESGVSGKGFPETTADPNPTLPETGIGQGVERQESRGGDDMEIGESQESGVAQEQPAEFAARVSALENELRARDVDAKIEDLKRRGKLVPAAEAFARSLLMADDQVVAFGNTEQQVEVAKAFEAFLEAQPKVIEFSELTRGTTAEKLAFSSEVERLFEKLGVTAAAVAEAGDR